MSAGGPEDDRTGAAHERCFTTSVLSVSGRSHALNCDLLVLWDRPPWHRPPCANCRDIWGDDWMERVSLVRVDDVLRGTYFHLTLRNMPVGVRLRMKWFVDGEDTVDTRYEVEKGDGFGGANNVLYIDPKIVRPSTARFPVALPLHGDALVRAIRATKGELETAHMPEETIETVRLYHSYKHMRDLKDANPDMGWAEVKDRAALEAKRANRRKVKKKKASRTAGKSLSSLTGRPRKQSAVCRGFSRLHIGMEGSQQHRCCPRQRLVFVALEAQRGASVSRRGSSSTVVSSGRPLGHNGSGRSSLLRDQQSVPPAALPR